MYDLPLIVQTRDGVIPVNNAQLPMNKDINPSFGQVDVSFQREVYVEPHIQNKPVGVRLMITPQQYYALDTWFKEVVEKVEHSDEDLDAIIDVITPEQSNQVQNEWYLPIKASDIRYVESMDIFARPRNKKHRIPRVVDELKAYLLRFFRLPEDLIIRNRKEVINRVCGAILRKTGKEIERILVELLYCTLRKNYLKSQRTNIQG